MGRADGRIGPVTLPAPSDRRAGRFTFSDDPALAKHDWPFFAFAGREAGPTVLITAGIHAAELLLAIGALG